MRAVLAIALVAVCGCHKLNARSTPLRKGQGTTTAKSWCDPSRGLPADPALGVDRPIRLGVGSIVHAGDSTTESFLAARAFTNLVRLTERRVTVSVVDHPTDADYSVMGSVRGPISYARETEMGPIGWTGLMVGAFGYLGGGTIAGTALLIDAISDDENAAVGTFKTIGFIGLALGVAGNIALGTRPANRYSWDQTATLTLRRGTVVIGEFEVRTIHDRVQWSPLASPRQASLANLWQQASREIGTCIAADLDALLARPDVAEVFP